MAQFDLSGADERYHTQYLLLRHALMYKIFDLALSGALELSNTEDDGTKPALAFSAEAGLQLPTALKDRLSLGLDWASGDGSGTAAFFPVTHEAQGYALEPGFSGIMILRANYHAYFLQSISADIGCRYLIRTDSTSFAAPYLENDAYPLGLELDAGLLWVPMSDVSLSMKGGIFLPKTGSAWADDAPVLWRLTIGTMLSF